MSNEIVPFSYPYNEFPFEGFTGEDGEPRFVAANICAILKLTDVSMTMQRIPDDEKELLELAKFDHKPDLWSKIRYLWVVNEPGLYRLIMRSDRPEAEEFQRWVFHVVLPQIRKTGSYSKPLLDEIAVARQLEVTAHSLVIALEERAKLQVLVGSQDSDQKTITRVLRELGIAKLDKGLHESFCKHVWKRAREEGIPLGGPGRIDIHNRPATTTGSEEWLRSNLIVLMVEFLKGRLEDYNE